MGSPVSPVVANLYMEAFEVRAQGTEENYTQPLERYVDDMCITSYYMYVLHVTALFTAVPVSSALDIIKNRLKQDTDLQHRTIMSANNIIELLECCLNHTFFLFPDQFFEQTKGAAMG